jgi:hypothetical protein
VFGSPRLSRDELSIQRTGESRDDFISHVEEIGHRFIKPFSPEIAGFDVDQLHIYPKPFATTLDGALKDIANVQVAADLFDINRFAFAGPSSRIQP